MNKQLKNADAHACTSTTHPPLPRPSPTPLISSLAIYSADFFDFFIIFLRLQAFLSNFFLSNYPFLRDSRVAISLKAEQQQPKSSATHAVVPVWVVR